MDHDGNGQVSLEEFLYYFVESEVKIKTKLNETLQIINERQKQQIEFRKNLEEAELTERLNQHGIMDGSILTVSIVESEDLNCVSTEGGTKQSPTIILSIEGQKIESWPKEQVDENHFIWDHNYTFDIEHGQEDLQVIAVNKDSFATNEIIGMTTVSLNDLEDQMIKEGLYQLYRRDDPSEPTGSIYLRIQWIYCRREYFKNYLAKVEESLEIEEEKKRNYESHLQKFQMPFKDILSKDDFAYDSDFDQEKLELRARQGDNEAHLKLQERAYSKKVDALAMSLARKAGMEQVPWFVLTWVVTWTYLVLSLSACFFRADFVNVTIGAVSIYMLTETQEIRKTTFRNLVIAIVFSFFYDFIFLLEVSGDYGKDNTGADGGLEKGVRKFSLSMTTTSFFFRVSFA